MENKKEEKKVRAPNFTVREKEILIDLVSAQKSIIENKKTDSITCEQKKQTWIKISQDFNALSPAIFPRNVESLKKFYNNKKEELRKSLALEKRELYRTGGGLPPAPPPRDGADKKLANIINEKTLYGVPSSIAPYDDDFDDVRENVYMEPNINPKDSERNIRETTSWAKPSISRLTAKKHENLLTSVNKIQEPIKNQNNIEVIMESEVFELQNTDIFIEKPIRNLNTMKILMESQDFDLEDADMSKIAEKEEIDISQPLKVGIPNKKIAEEKNKKTIKTRKRVAGRAAPCVRTLTSSRLGELYEKLVEKKMELVEYLTKEHEARMNILELEKKIKEKQLAILVEESKNSSEKKAPTAISSINVNLSEPINWGEFV